VLRKIQNERMMKKIAYIKGAGKAFGRGMPPRITITE
jgi:hypothetical protein